MSDLRKLNKCLESECDKTTVWFRITQFAGEHPFCEKHAMECGDFGKEDDSYFYWMKAKADLFKD